jgi:catechol 2,3-dioxygenase-like lactoylglutathione lyase family enzyme
MRLQPIVYVTDMAAAVAWYSDLLDRQPEVDGEHWTSFPVEGGYLALHLTDETLGSGRVALSLVVDEPLETLADRMPQHDGIVEQPFGRSLTVRDPDGTVIQVNEHRPA